MLLPTKNLSQSFPRTPPHPPPSFPSPPPLLNSLKNFYFTFNTKLFFFSFFFFERNISLDDVLTAQRDVTFLHLKHYRSLIKKKEMAGNFFFLILNFLLRLPFNSPPRNNSFETGINYKTFKQ